MTLFRCFFEPSHVHKKRQVGKEGKKIGVATANGVIIVPVPEIVYVKANGSSTQLFLKNKAESILSTKNLKDFEDILSDFQFFRIHNSFLINLAEVKNYLKGNGEGGSVIMSNDVQLDVSKRKKAAFLSVLIK